MKCYAFAAPYGLGSRDMAHTVRDKVKLLARVRRIQGQTAALEKQLAELDVTAVRHAGQLPAGGAAKAHGRERLALLKAMLDK